MWSYYPSPDHNLTFVLLGLYITLRERKAGHNPQAARRLKGWLEELKWMEKEEKWTICTHKHYICFNRHKTVLSQRWYVVLSKSEGLYLKSKNTSPFLFFFKVIHLKILQFIDIFRKVTFLLNPVYSVINFFLPLSGCARYMIRIEKGEGQKMADVWKVE